MAYSITVDTDVGATFSMVTFAQYAEDGFEVRWLCLIFMGDLS